MPTFGQRLRLARERAGLTQAQVMELTSISDKSISRYENDGSFPDFDSIIAFINLYNISADYLFGLTEEMTLTTNDGEGKAHYGPTVSHSKGAYDLFDSLSSKSKLQALDYMEMLHTIDNVKS